MRQHGEIIRRVRLHPATGVYYSLTLRDTGRRDNRGQTELAFSLRKNGRILVQGAGFHGSPLHADDSDATVRSFFSFYSAHQEHVQGVYRRGTQHAPCNDCVIRELGHVLDLDSEHL